MTAATVGAITFACAFGSAVGAAYLQDALPPQHLSKESQDVVVELDGPFDGLIKVSGDPLRFALANLGQ